jgi:hypothetical protein
MAESYQAHDFLFPGAELRVHLDGLPQVDQQVAAAVHFGVEDDFLVLRVAIDFIASREDRRAALDENPNQVFNTDRIGDWHELSLNDGWKIVHEFAS